MPVLIVDANRVLRDFTIDVEVRVVNRRWVKLRLWLAVRLCHLAAWIGGMGLKVNQQVGVLVTDVPGREVYRP